MSRDLGPMPEPQIEPGEPNPGGVDAIDDDSGPILIPDLTAEENPALEHQAPDSVVEDVSGSEDTSTDATRSDDGEDDEPEKEATE
jgi:hypothetical protein